MFLLFHGLQRCHTLLWCVLPVCDAPGISYKSLFVKSSAGVSSELSAGAVEKVVGHALGSVCSCGVFMFQCRYPHWI